MNKIGEEMEHKELCVNCKYFEPSEGQCRRYPPQLVSEEGITVMCWLDVSKDNCWCGEWREKIGKPEDHVEVTIQNNLTGLVTKSSVCNAPKPDQVTIWELRPSIALSDDLSIRVHWPLEKQQ